MWSKVNELGLKKEVKSNVDKDRYGTARKTVQIYLDEDSPGGFCMDCENYRNGGFCSKKEKSVGALWQKKCFKQGEVNPPQSTTNQITMNTTKQCSVCGRELPLEQFHNNKKMKDGKMAFCKECHSKSAKKGGNPKFKKTEEKKEEDPVIEIPDNVVDTITEKVKEFRESIEKEVGHLAPTPDSLALNALERIIGEDALIEYIRTADLYDSLVEYYRFQKY